MQSVNVSRLLHTVMAIGGIPDPLMVSAGVLPSWRLSEKNIGQEPFFGVCSSDAAAATALGQHEMTHVVTFVLMMSLSCLRCLVGTASCC